MLGDEREVKEVGEDRLPRRSLAYKNESHACLCISLSDFITRPARLAHGDGMLELQTVRS